MPEELLPPITWRPDFATGVAIVDDQHRVLIRLLGEAGSKLSDRSPIEDFTHIVEGLLSYAGYHFQTEAKLMGDHAYEALRPEEANDHLLQHEAFADRVGAIHSGLKAGQRIAKTALMEFLISWLSNHILNTDKALGAFIADRQGAHGPANG
ncbi:MAG TPA: hemerythrin family protein [Rhodospirillaceae bacterium]|nr:hemerythrin family protein [Rhodospirillaceae bacterium]